MKLKKPKFWELNKPNLFAYLLFPFTIFAELNNYFLNKKTKKNQKKLKTICVGNIYLGGTGKTPLAIKLYEELEKLKFKKGNNLLISNITADEILNSEELKNLLTKQIENRVRWRESIIKMINEKVDRFIEIGPGKVLSGLIKRINKEVEVMSINSEQEIKNIKI